MKSSKNEWRVTQAESGQKLVAFLKSKYEDLFSARYLKGEIDDGQCSINGKIERFSSSLVGQGDTVILVLRESNHQRLKNSIDAKARFLYVDETIVAYDKPPGISSEDSKLIKVVQEKCSGSILLHRLDRDTTGVLLFARTKDIETKMLLMFKQHQMQKQYLAVVDGIPSMPSGTVENFLGKRSVYQGQTLWGSVSREKGVFASTAWQIKKIGKGVALLVCMPKTGRTHQIRVHLAGLGFSILGDAQYGRAIRSLYRPSRLMLHASEIAFIHPVSKQLLKIKAPIPEDFQGTLDVLFGEKKLS